MEATSEMAERFSAIKENLKNEIFTETDADLFLSLYDQTREMDSVPGIVYNSLMGTHLAYASGLLASGMTANSTVILEILDNEEAPILYRDLNREFSEKGTITMNWASEYELDNSLDIMIHPSSKPPLVEEKGLLRKNYAITDEGRIALKLIRHLYSCEN